MNLFTRFKNNVETRTQMVALSDFYVNLTQPINQSDRSQEINAYLDARAEHGTLNEWPFNKIALDLDHKSGDTASANFSSICSDRRVRSFIEGYTSYLNASKEEYDASIKVLEHQLTVTKQSKWWEHENIELKLQAFGLLTEAENKHKELLTDINDIEKYLSNILYDVYMDMGSIKVDNNCPPALISNADVLKNID